MRHSVYGKHLGRDKNQRTALIRGLVRSLILHGSIQTTEAKAKAIKGLVDKLITKSRKNTPSTKMAVLKLVNQKEVSEKLFTEVAPSFKERTSGYTNMVRVGQRLGDGAMMVKLSLITESSKPAKSATPKESKTEEKTEVVEKPKRVRKASK